ncbi:dCTP deaminase [Microgenomates group bacterium RIFCSPLOWO2_01_FULL_46_13]|nr:MAG: dCTP deaminase [Microgenomates group bacterium RIFCSPHIGHO2_01_FULL_45_11]OGV94766.1 MAG: dCTP deaminase [Microgenomates group bacterium RIFCSPLOWO2_01_FULL_46_13]
MILADKDLKKALRQKRIIFRPTLDLKTQLGSCSVDLRLGTSFSVFKHSRFPYIDPHDPKLSSDMMESLTVAVGDKFILQPGDFVLAVSIESFKLPNNLLARIEGRSSLGRLGIVVHSTASIFEPGWEGVAVMELGNMGRMPVALYPGMRIAALTFEELSSPAEVPYSKKRGAKYLKQKTPTASKIAEESS